MATEIADALAVKVQLKQQISLEGFLTSGGTEEEWKKTETARNMFIELNAKHQQRRLCQDQAEQLALDSTDASSSLRRSFIRLFTTSKLGLGILSTGAGKRKSRQQSKFRTELIEAYNARGDGAAGDEEFLWCPVLATWVHQSCATAAHVFGYMNGQESMTAIFGPTNKPELWSPRNGMIISSTVEEKFESGLYVIVPDLPENASPAEMALWNNSEPKEYKLKIIDLNHPSAERWFDKVGGLKWKDLDNKRLVFRSSFRPRARYLYYHYCTQLLRRAWNEDYQGDILKHELKKRFWGTPGKYIRESMLRAFVEELGHGFEDLLEGAADDVPGAPRSDPSLLVAATNQIEKVVQEPEDSDDDDDDEDED